MSFSICFFTDCRKWRPGIKPDITYDLFQDWRTLFVPKGSKLKLKLSYLFLLSIASNTFKMTREKIAYAKKWWEVTFLPILRYFFEKYFFPKLFLFLVFSYKWNTANFKDLHYFFITSYILYVFPYFPCYSWQSWLD